MSQAQAIECPAVPKAERAAATAECLTKTSEMAASLLRRESDTRMNEMSQRIDNLAEGHKTLVEEVKKNTEITQRIETSTAGLVEAWTAISGGMKVLGFLGKVAKWISYIAGAVTAAYAAWHLRDGGPPL